MKIGHYLADAITRQGQQIGQTIGMAQQTAWQRQAEDEQAQLRVGQFLAKLMDMQNDNNFARDKQTSLEDYRGKRLKQQGDDAAATNDREKIKAIASSLVRAGLTEHATKVLQSKSLADATAYLQGVPDIQGLAEKEFKKKENVKAYSKAAAEFDYQKKMLEGQSKSMDAGPSISIGPPDAGMSSAQSILDKYAPVPSLNIPGGTSAPGAIPLPPSVELQRRKVAKPPSVMPIVTQALRNRSFSRVPGAGDPFADDINAGMEAYNALIRGDK
jgi:hypothetical protein